MLNNYLKTAIRNLLKTRMFSLVNILGLAIGMSACLLILHYVRFERNYDRFHPDSDRIYRLRYERISENGEAVRFASCCPPAGALLRDRFPEVEKLARLYRHRATVSVGETHFLEDRMYFAEPDYFEIFPGEILAGDFRALREVNTAVLSRSTARKYFGDGDPLGKTISVDKKTDYQVVGVFSDIPPYSHLKFDIFLSFQNIAPLFGNELLQDWGETGFFTYLKLKPETNMPALTSKVQALVDASFGEVLRAYRMQMLLPLQPLGDIHLNSHYMQEHEINGNRDAVNALFVIALFILAIAWVNYVNLSTARALTRAREVGLRKVVGASRLQVAAQFFCETILINGVAAVCTLVGVWLVSPLFRWFTGTPLDFGIFSQGWFWAVFFSMIAAGVFLSGLYPIVVLSAFKPAAVLKDDPRNPTKSGTFRKALVAFQFVMALTLLICTFTVFTQIRHLQSQALGFDNRRIMVVKAPRVRDGLFDRKFDTFKEEVHRLSGIAEVCLVSEVPGRQILNDAGGIRRAGEPPSQGKNYQIVGADADYLKVFDLKLAAGRYFSRDFPADAQAILLNETAVKWMGFRDNEAALGQQVDFWGKLYTVVGVMKDFRQQSAKQAFEPHLFLYEPYGRGVRGHFALKLGEGDPTRAVDFVKQRYQAFFPGNPFDFFFLEDYYNEQYRGDHLFGGVFAVFAFLALFVCSLGLFGLSSYLTLQRRKEIGIRKVLGAGVAQVLLLLSRGYLGLLLASCALAFPLALLATSEWLQTFAVRTPLRPALFLGPLAVVTAVTLLTIAFNILKAAFTNPVQSIRSE